ncbi:MAG: hypothetical protein U1E76_14755 [Planctomycetota bacterium]
MTRLLALLRVAIFVGVCLVPAALPQSLEDAALWVSDTDGSIESGWIVQLPAGSADYFNVAHAVTAAANADELSLALPVTAIGVSVADFGALVTFPAVGVFFANLALDASGNTPDLAAPLSRVSSPALAPSGLFDFVAIDLPDATIPSGTTKLHAVVQLPAGETGQLAVGADTSGAAGTSFSTRNGYVSIGQPFPGNLGLNVGQDNGTSKTDGRLRLASDLQDRTGDRLALTVAPGKDIQLAMFAPHSIDKWMLFLADAACVPAIRVGGVLPVTADPDGDGGYLRVGIRWPIGFGGQTFHLAAAYGDANAGAHGFTNCVTIVADNELPFGRWDDGGIDAAWFISLPSGPSDYFSVDFLGPPANVNNVIGLRLAVMDFGTLTPAFPEAGVAGPNNAIDPTGLTPDLAHPLAQIAPFTFPPGTMATTSAAYVQRPLTPIAKSQLPGDTICYVKFPPGDSGLLAIGADTDSDISGYSAWSADGFTTAGHRVGFANWGIRLVTN